MHIDITEQKKCCGCTACAQICPQKAIAMVPDCLGFNYPKVDVAKCIECGVCIKVCNFKSDYKRTGLYETPKVYGCRYSNETELLKSQSGALAYSLGEQFIRNGGIVYGAIMESVSEVSHCKCITISDLQKTRYSKYVQSNPKNTFTEVKDALKNDQKILYFGTPCQIAGLKSFLGNKQIDNLTTCDLVCHGVPSPSVWKEYCKVMEGKRGKKLDWVLFRDKRCGWHSHSETFKYKKSQREDTKNTFRKLFYDHLIVRESCSNCHFANTRRIGDITCGDFWGWEKFHAEWNDNKGVSLALINSDKGYKLFRGASLHVIPSNLNECIQPQLQYPIELSPLYMEFCKLFADKGFVYVAKKYADWGWKYKFKMIISHLKRVSGYNIIKNFSR